MKRAYILVLLFLMVQGLSAQDKEKVEEKKFGISFKGFVKNDFFWDSRQTVAAREGHFLLWPSAQNLDINDVDINARSNFNFLAVQSRLTGVITGPDAFGAKTSGVIEGDFFAQSNANINLLRLRHAFIKLNWEKTEIMTGQYWNPLFVTGCFPGTVSFNTGTPLQSFARNPQVRLTRKIGKLQLVAATLSQRDYSSRGPDPSDTTHLKTIVSTDFLRNSMLPDMHLQLIYSTANPENGTSLFLGAGAAYKRIIPRLYDDAVGKAVVDEYVGGLTSIAFAKYTTQKFTTKLQVRYGENTADILSPSGFAVTNMVVDGNGIVTQSYAPLTNATIWGEVHTNGKKLQAGIFGGYLRNYGTNIAREDVNYPVYGLATNIVSLARISPRIIFVSGKFKLGCELEYTWTKYGSDFDEYYMPRSAYSVANSRLLISTIYSF